MNHELNHKIGEQKFTIRVSFAFGRCSQRRPLRESQM